VTFAAPGWIHLLWPALALVAWLVWLEQRRSDALERFVSRLMQHRLASRPPRARRFARIACFALALGAAIVALMRPQTTGGIEAIESSRMTGDVMVVLDVSKSMLAEDAAPSRLERAKADVLDLGAKLKGYRLGLTAFAGRGVVLCPLTPDHAFFRMVLKGARPTSVSPGGTRIGDGIRAAIQAFPDGPGSKMILLVTDGEDHESNPLDAAKVALDAGIRIVAIGFGDEKGSDIVLKDAETGARKVLTDRSGNVVKSRLDGETLRKIALGTEGAYVPAGTAALDLESIVRDHIQPLARMAAEKSLRRVALDHYPWCLLVAVVALLGAAWSGAIPRHGLALVLVLACTGVAHAGGGSPRHGYNEARRAFAKGDYVAAQKGFLEARDSAAGDVDLRYRAAFNLGLTFAKQADANKDKPQEALDVLKQSAAWFRDALHLRSEDNDARVSLEVVLRRIQALADQLNKGQNSLEARLGRAIEDERALGGQLGELWDRIAAAGAEREPLHFRDDFQTAETAQRTLLADATAVSDLAGDETAKIQTKGEKERTDEERMRLVMLGNMDKYMEVARPAMADARHLLARLQVEKAHERVGTAVEALKRAREQVQDPITVLKGVAEEEVTLRTQTGALDGLRHKAFKLESGDTAKAPVWLTAGHLGEGQTSVQGRTSELLARLRAGVEHDPPKDTDADPRAKQVLAAAKDAIPPLEAAEKAMSAAKDALAADDLAAATKSESDALTGLFAALEKFSDIRSLIELAYGDHKKIVELLTPNASDHRSTRERETQLHELEQHNRDRLTRLGQKIAAEQAALAQAKQPDEKAQGQKQLYEQAETERKNAESALETEGHAKGTAVLESAKATLTHIEALRRLFFSIVEHLKELAENQGNTRDRTAAAQGAKSDTERQEKLGPALAAQQRHTEMGGEIAKALRKQADEAGKSQDAQAQQAAKQLAAAAPEVESATEAMQQAGDSLAQGTGKDASMSLDLSAVVDNQKQALAHLAKAIELLSPPQQQQNQQQDKQQEQKQVSGEQAARQLQEVREREAARQRDKQKRERIAQEPVEKDW
jgi:Ca-activated chloride channel family protein